MNILHKLGLYKKSEIDNLIAMTNKFVSSTDSVINEMRETQECYKVALRLLKEANSVEHAVKVIKAYCKERDCYEDCSYIVKIEDGCCVCGFAHMPPCEWGV